VVEYRPIMSVKYCLPFTKFCIACLSACENSMEIMTEADRNAVTQCVYHDHRYAAMSGVSDAIFSTFICLCMTCMMTSQVLLCLSFCTYKQVPQRHGVQFSYEIHIHYMTCTFGWFSCYMHCSEHKQFVRPVCVCVVDIACK